MNRLHPSSPAPVWTSLGVVGLGFAAIAYGWSLVAGTDRAGQQVAPLVGFGIGGIALVVLGALALKIVVARRDAAIRERGAAASVTVAKPHAWVEAAAAATAVAGVAAIAFAFIGARGESETEFVRPYLASGGLGGAGLLVVAGALVRIRMQRRGVASARGGRAAVAGFAAGLALLSLLPLAASDRADAQQLPTDLLEPAAPVLAVIGPAAGPACGGLGVVALLAPAALKDQAKLVLPLLGPAFTVCGVIPGAPPNDRYACSFDNQALSLIGAVTGLAGVPPAVDVRPVGQVLETLGAALDLVLPPAQVDAALEQPSIVLQCTHGPGVDPPLTTPPGSPTSTPVPSFGNPSDPSFGGGLPVGPATPALQAFESPTTNDPTPAGVVTPFGRVPFSYAAVFVLPFLALLAGAGIGKAVLLPIPLDPRSI